VRGGTKDERRLLELLTASDDGCTEAFLQGAYGFMLDLMLAFPKIAQLAQ
jgi:hypothetical protein